MVASSRVSIAKWPLLIALGTIVIHLLTGNRYGFHRDELMLLDDARHLAWGYIVYPPVTPFFAWLALKLFGTSLVGFRLFASLAQALAVYLTGLMARDMGGEQEAQAIAALAAVPFCLGGGAIMQYISFDYIAWVLTAYFLVKLLSTEDPRWCVAIGSSIGLGLMSKYTMTFFAVGIGVAMAVTPARRYFRSVYLWIGVGVALLICLPNLVWQANHHFISYEFLKFLHKRDVWYGLTRDFLPDQLQQTMLAFPLWVAGLWFCLRSAQGKRYRAIGWAYVVTLILFTAAQGRGYYLAPAYPMLYAAGAVLFERWFAKIRQQWVRPARGITYAALNVSIVGAMAIALPIAPPNSRWWNFAVSIDTALPEEIGWPEYVAFLAQIRDALPANQRDKVGILAGNYGEVGAINLFGPAYHLPRAISPVNSSWERGYGDPPPETVIIVGYDRIFVETNFTSCRLAAHPWNYRHTPNEETVEHPDIFVCGPPKDGWAAFWATLQSFA